MDLARLDITPALRTALEPLILDTLFEYCVRHRTRAGVASDSAVQLTLVQAMEVLAAHQTRWKERLQSVVAPLNLAQDGLPRRTGVQLQELLLKAHEFFRREGAATFRAASAVAEERRRFRMLWTDLFSRRVLDWLRENELITDTDNLDIADALVECAKLWTLDIARQIDPATATRPPEPSGFFLDADSEITALFERGPVKLKVRGRPEALLLRPVEGGFELHEYKFGEPDLAELRIAQMVLYMALLERAKKVTCLRGTLGLFRAHSSNDLPGFPPEVEQAFAGFLGNAAVVRRLKLKASLARRDSPPRMGDNLLLSGPGGLGKTELARRMARAVDTPLVELTSGVLKGPEELIAAIDKTLAETGRKPVESGREDGRPVLVYPPLVLLLRHAHELRRKTEALASLIDLKERRLVTATCTALFPSTIILATTPEPGKLSEAFLSRFRRLDLELYLPEEVAVMLRPVFEEKGMKLSDPLALLLARIGRCNPRRALELAREFRDHHEYAPAATPLTREALLKLARTDWHVDERGLTTKDYQYLAALESGPKGLPALQQLLPFGGDEVTALIEPYLLQLGTIHRSARGRVLTVLGEQLLHRRSG